MLLSAVTSTMLLTKWQKKPQTRKPHQPQNIVRLSCLVWLFLIHEKFIAEKLRKHRLTDKSTFTKQKERKNFCVLRKANFSCKLIQAEACYFTHDWPPVSNPLLKNTHKKTKLHVFLSKSQNITPTLRLMQPAHLKPNNIAKKSFIRSQTEMLIDETKHRRGL